MNLSIICQPKVRSKRLISIAFVSLSIIIPIILMVLSLMALHVTPFGNHTLAISDGRFYLNGEMFFKRLLLGQENIFYSFNNGPGYNEWGKFAWGGFSFGNLLSIFASIETIPTIFTWICVANVALCGLSMYLLLSYIYGLKTSNLIFSTSYSLIGFNIVNCYQTGFLIGPELLPLVILGIIFIIRGKSPLIYILSLGLCAFLNFYFAFHLSVFSILFFFSSLYALQDECHRRRVQLFFTWAFSSLIAGLLSAPMWLPAMKSYSGGGRLDQTGLSEYSFAENMPFSQIFTKLFTGANSTNELIQGAPNIFCGILVVVLVILYFMNKNVYVKRKRAAAILLIIYLLSFYLMSFTLLMHGGTHTNWFPYRYSYIFSFILIGLAAEEYCYIDYISLQHVKISCIVLVISSIIIFNTKYEYISGGSIILDFALLLLMGIGFWLYKTKPNQTPLGVLSLFLLILVSVNQYANIILSIKGMQEWEYKVDEYESSIMPDGALVDAANIVEGDNFFRMEKDSSDSSSVGADSLLYNYNGVSHSGPGERSFVHRGLSKLGINWFDMRHFYSEGIPAATDTLLGLKYIISDRDLSEEKGYDREVTINETSLYRNRNMLSVATLSSDSVNDITLGNNVFENLNDIWCSMTGDERPIFIEHELISYTLHNPITDQTVTSNELKVSLSDSENEVVNDIPNGPYIEYSFIAERDGPIYVFDTSIPDSVNGLDSPAIKYCGYFHAGDEVLGHFDINGMDYGTLDLLRGYCVNQVFAYANNDVLCEDAKLINSRSITSEVPEENYICGTFNADKDQSILFTVPWDEGWKCYIDGQEYPIKKIWDLFMSVDVPDGSHTYEMIFIPAWLNYGLIMFGVGVVGLIAMLSFSFCRPKESDVTLGDMLVSQDEVGDVNK